MLDLLASLPATAMAHWPAFALAAYLGIGFRIGLGEALASRRALRRDGVDDSLWPTLALLTTLWPMIFAQRLVEWVIIAALMIRTDRLEKREARDA